MLHSLFFICKLKKIYDVACTEWQSRIEKYAQRNPFGEEIEFSEKEIQEMISACTAEQLPIVKEIFNIQNTWENIKSLEDAIKYLGESDEEVKTLKQLNGCSLPRHIVAEQELVVIIKALNEKQELDWNNDNEYKYFIWWYLGNNFRVNYVDYYFAVSFCSARLLFKSESDCRKAVEEFLDIFKESRLNF